MIDLAGESAVGLKVMVRAMEDQGSVFRTRLWTLSY